MILDMSFVPIFSLVFGGVACLIVYNGWQKGLVSSLISLATSVAALLLAFPAASWLESLSPHAFDFLNPLFETVPWMKQGVWLAISIAGFQILALILSRSLSMVKKVPLLSTADHIAGAAFSALQVLLIGWLTICILNIPVFVNGTEFANASILGWASRELSPWITQLMSFIEQSWQRGY